MYEPQELVQMDLEHVLHPMHDRAHNANGPIVLVKGQGATVTDATGKEYIDGFGGLWNVNVGHGRAELARAAADQMEALAYASGYAGSSNVPAILLADRLADMAPGDLKATFYTTGGAESNETAFKIARFYWKMTGRPDKVKIISRQRSYHGLTAGATSATGQRIYWRFFDPLPSGFCHVPTCHCLHCTLHKSYPECGVACADTLEQQILAEDPETVAAFIAEPVAGSGGVIVPPAEYFPKIREICNRYDVLFIADEVITGFARTGTMFGLQQWDVVCDIMSFAKGVTSAYMPLGGVMVGERVHRVFREMPQGVSFNHGYTYSLHPTCCAVALKNLDIIEQEGLAARAESMGARLMSGLSQLERLPGVVETRGLGLMAAVELGDGAGKPLPDSQAMERINRQVLDRGLIVRARGDSIYMAPPLVISEQQVDAMVNILGDAIASTIGG